MNKKLGLGALTALVLSSMVGAGVFSLPQNMAAVASPAALLIGWTITGVGIIFLALALLHLSRLRPDLEGGIFTYAREGFGEFVGFCSAWGYWLCAVIANVSYLVIVFATLSFFTDSPGHVIFGDGNTWQALIGASALLWIVHAMILRGVQQAASINMLATIAKLIPLCAFIVLAAFFFKWETFHLDFTGAALDTPIWQQVKETMLITVWVFIGVEGAVVVSSRAKNKHDIGRATMLGLLSALGIYLLVTLLAVGVMPRAEVAELRNPSMAGMLDLMIGPMGKIIISLGLIVSVCGAYLSWTILAAEVPYVAALQGAFPRYLSKMNANGSPAASLWLTNGAVQIALLLIYMYGGTYNTLLTIASEMVLVPYFLVGAFLLKLAIKKQSVLLKSIGAGACIYGIWLLYASGLTHLMMSVLMYAPGLLIFFYARRNDCECTPLKKMDRVGVSLLLLSVLPAAWLLSQGIS
ncbi:MULTISPECIES: amino acid permease [Plesiomonas]|uniref:Arginine/ornithine antiporter n=1 Tax=Plesiomonas shigelloides 302-73 TaxID=1315976 RepID=R8AQL8_PLESH|nr:MULTISPECIES: amino acid permease [Plesiomonas]AVQ86392.1 amino acid permease [Plesiomonas shigelloides]EON88626.1 arginine/ornithine antiporter [Plesiomonas shigelloides 302-73]KAB7689507.1 amino acid permease [Plesiomonas shigelloides]KAB7695161.1 amino acid permease [Plesiomonas shigelloides]KAB7697818.1 amino acid permease [Plesiomonas shigelloides]